MPTKFETILQTHSPKRSSVQPDSYFESDDDVNYLAEAIKKQESGGNYTARSKDGSFGAYQFLKSTWDGTAPKFGVKSQWQKATPQEQDRVAKLQIKEWKDKGLTPAQIAAKWNSGSEFGWENKRGVNSAGVKYDVPAYVNSVLANFKRTGQLPKYQKSTIDPNLKISAPTGKSVSLAELPEGVRQKAQAETRESQIAASGKSENFFSMLARAPFKAAQAVALDYMNPEGGSQFTPQTQFEKLLFGENTIKSASLQYNEANQTLESGGYGKLAPGIAGVAAFGGIIMDLTPFGGSRKKLAEQLAKETSEDIIIQILKKSKIADDVIKNYADDFVRANTPEAVETVFKNIDEIKRVSNNLLKNNPGITRTDAEAMARDVIRSRQFNTLDPLAQEARKYKSAEEFESAVLGGKIPESRLKEMGFEVVSNGRIRSPQGMELTDIYNQATKNTQKSVKEIGQSRITDINKFEKAIGLSDEASKLEAAAQSKVIKNEEAILEAYRKKYGKVVNVDEFRKEFIKEGYNGINSPAVQEPASYLGKRMWVKNLSENPGSLATLYAGGGGVGKSSAIKNLPELATTIEKSAAILDGNLSKMSSAIQRIEEAKAFGKKPNFIYVYRNPVDAFENGVVKRMIENEEEMGRLVPISALVENHTGSLETIKQLYNDLPEDLRDAFTFINNADPRGPKFARLMDFDEVSAIKYPSDLRERLVKKADELYRNGTIDAAQFEGYTGLKAVKREGILPTGRLSAKAEKGRALAAPVSQTARLAQKEAATDFSKVSSYLDDTTKLKTSQRLINLDNLNISSGGKKIIEEEFAGLGDHLGKTVGSKLTNKEAMELAEKTAEVLKSGATRSQTLKWESGLLKLRQRMADAAESGQVTEQFIQDLVQVKEIGTDIGRKLQSFSIAADPKKVTAKQFVLEEVLKFTDNIDEVIKASKGVDFNNLTEASSFYREFIKPKTSEWVDLIRYNSMLSSPLTHLVNTFSNIANTVVARPLTKLIAGGVDMLSSLATGQARKQFSGEAGAYLAGYIKNVQEGFDRFLGVWKGTREFTHLDLRRQLPLATKGPASVVEKILNPPMKMLEATDQFFTALAEGGETAALSLRQSKGVVVKNAEELAEQGARYSLFRQELFKEGQGMVLDAIDVMTSKVLSLRNSENPFVSTVAKFTVPFVSTPMNIFKQGIEYSPAGFLTLMKNTNKTEQLAKAVIGTGVAVAAGTLIASNRMTWGEPKAEAERNAWRENGQQSYSVKIGDRWYSYQKLPPFLSFPLSMIAATHDAVKNKKMTDNTAELVLTSFAKYSEFLADQSYFKSIGDFFDALSGNETAISRLIGNYPQQLVPFRALGGWMARLSDGTQRQINNQAGFIDKQVQLLMMNIPFVSQYVPPRLGTDGQPIPARDQVINAFSPVRTSKQSDEEARRMQNIEELKQIKSQATQESQLLKEEAITLDAELSELSKEEAMARASQVKKDNPKLYDKLKDVVEERKLGLTYEDKKIKALGVENGDRAEFIKKQLDNLETNEERAKLWEEYKRKKLISEQVAKQLKKLK